MNVVGYCRLSRDEDRENYASIEEQQNIIRDYATSRNWTIKRFYIDDNVSGYTFARPEFSEMLKDLDNGEVDCIIAKDLSRIGRNNGKTLVLIDELKTKEKNMILVYEYGGTYDILNDRDDTIGITTWFNERYVKDISRKVRANMLSKQKQGKLVMGNYFGYVKGIEDKTKLIIDKNILPCIQLIFDLYTNENLGCKRICDYLNENTNYPTPSVYYKSKHTERGRVYKHKIQPLWSTHMVRDIIKNDVYCGTLRTHKKKTMSIRGRVVKLPKDEHFVFENHHEAMISKEQFNLANEIIKKRAKEMTSSTASKYDYIFRGIIVCGDCGSNASGKLIRRKGNKPAYECTQYIKYGKKRCKCHEIEEELILNHFKEFLKVLRREYREVLKQINIEKKDNRKQDEKEVLSKQLDTLEQEINILYDQKIKELLKESNNDIKKIMEKTYNELETKKIQEITNVKKRLEYLNTFSRNNAERKIKDAIRYFDDIVKAKIPNKKTIYTILNRVYIFNDKTIKYDLKINIKDWIESI